jgi:hypothetical protein
MIVTDASRLLPETWTDALCIDLVDHARDLGHNGNPGGYMLQVALCPFLGEETGDGCVVKPRSEWDYDGMRAWIAENIDEVKVSWQRTVRSDLL